MYNPKVCFVKFLHLSPILIGLIVVCWSRVGYHFFIRYVLGRLQCLLPFIFPCIMPRRNTSSYLKTRLIIFFLFLCLIVSSITRVSYLSLRQPSFVLRRVQHFFASVSLSETASLKLSRGFRIRRVQHPSFTSIPSHKHVYYSQFCVIGRW